MILWSLESFPFPSTLLWIRLDLVHTSLVVARCPSWGKTHRSPHPGHPVLSPGSP